MTSKQQILEPISSMVKIALLNFSGKNTKLIIRDHGIYIDDPSDSVLCFQQSFIRFAYGDSKEDIYVLNSMIINYLDWYMINGNPDDYKIFRDIALFACNGIKKIQETYKSGNVVLSIQYYINLISRVVEDLDKTFENYPPHKKSNKLSNSSCDDSYKNINIDKLKIYVPEKTDETISIVDTSKVQSIWTIDDVRLLYKEINDCFENYIPKSGEFIDAKIKVLLEILGNKDTKFSSIVKDSYGGQ